MVSSYALETLNDHLVISDFVFIVQTYANYPRKTRKQQLKKYFSTKKKLFPEVYENFPDQNERIYKNKERMKKTMIHFYQDYCNKKKQAPRLLDFFDKKFTKYELYSFIWYTLHASCHLIDESKIKKKTLKKYFECIRVLLICSKCRKHFENELENHMKYNDRESIYWSMFNIHNHVNDRKKKKKMTKTHYSDLYKLVL